MKQRFVHFLTLTMLTLSLCISGCSDDDNSTGGTTPTAAVVASVDSISVMWGETCFALNLSFNGELGETDFMLIANDSVGSLGWQHPGESPVLNPSVWCPLNPTVGTSWLGWSGGPIEYRIEELMDISVPAGTFPAYICTAWNPTTDEYQGYMAFADGIGLISRMFIDVGGDGDTSLVSLQSYTIAGGEGLLPLAVGNEWRFTEGGFTPAD